MKVSVGCAWFPLPLRSPRSVVAGFFLLLFFVSTGYVSGADKPQGTQQAFQFARNPEIQQVKPRKPVRIKLHRSAKGEYSWDLSADSVDDVVRADVRLRKLLKVE